MKPTRWRPSPLSLVIAVVIILVSIAGYFFLQHSVDNQEKALLQSQTTDAGTTASSFFGQIITSVSNDAALVQTTGSSPAEFAAHFQPSPKNPLTPNLIQKVGNQYIVAVPTIAGLTAGQALTGPALAAVQKAAQENGVVTGPVTSNGKLSTARFATKVSGNSFIYLQFGLPPHINIAKALGSSAFSMLNVALYGPGPVHPGSLLVTTTNQLPLTGSIARTSVKVGASNYTLLATARSPFVSGLASSGPVILLVLGLFIALFVMLTVETVQRRHRYAQALVTERTSDLHNSLEELKDTQNALVQGERLSAVGEMASVIGHELRNPLAAVTNSLFIVRNDLGEDVSPITEKYLSLAERETSKAAALADDLTAFVRPRELKKTEIELRDLIEEVLGATPHPDNVELMVDVAPVDFSADRGQLAEVLTNLVTNAYQAMPDGGTLRLSGSSRADEVTIVVEDSGVGMDQAALDHIFEPFFTTKTSGTGLGLAIVQRLVEAHSGEIKLENVSGNGNGSGNGSGSGSGVRATVVLPSAVERVSV